MGTKGESADFLIGRRKALKGLGVVTLAGLGSCRKPRPDPRQITMRPRFILEYNPTVPVLLEFDVIKVDLGTVQNIFADDPKARSYALWFTFDRRAAIGLQTLTAKNIGKNLIFTLSGQKLGIHPIDNTISTGVLPVLLTSVKTEENARYLHDGLSSSIETIQYLLAKERNK